MPRAFSLSVLLKRSSVETGARGHGVDEADATRGFSAQAELSRKRWIFDRKPPEPLPPALISVLRGAPGLKQR